MLSALGEALQGRVELIVPTETVERYIQMSALMECCG